MLKAGLDNRRAGSQLTGDNHRVPYDATCGMIFDGFLAVDAPFPAPQLPAASLGFLSAPTIFLSGEAGRGFRFVPIQIANIAANPSLNAASLARFYTVRNAAIISADFSRSMTRPDVDWIDPGVPCCDRGGGAQNKPVAAALLDNLVAWVRDGLAPPPSLFNGQVKT